MNSATSTLFERCNKQKKTDLIRWSAAFFQLYSFLHIFRLMYNARTFHNETKNQINLQQNMQTPPSIASFEFRFAFASTNSFSNSNTKPSADSSSLVLDDFFRTARKQEVHHNDTEKTDSVRKRWQSCLERVYTNEMEDHHEH